MDSSGLARLGKVGVLGEESIARMNGIDASAFSCREDFLSAQVAVPGGGGSDGNSAICLSGMERIGVCLGIHGDGSDPHFSGGSHDAASDFAPIRDQ